MNVSQLPLVNACLNGFSAMLLLAGLVFIRSGRKEAHRRCMVSAFTVSCVFLLLYLFHKWQVKAVHTRFQGPDALRIPYYVMLFSHILLAAAVPPLAILTMRRASRGELESHRRIARWTWPIWMYVSITGVLVYLVLYQIWPTR